MALAKKPPIIRSPLLGAMNNIVNIKRSSAQMTATKNSLDDFIRFMNVEVKSLEAIKLPDQKKLSKLSTISMPSTFGRPGSLLASLFSGALDVGGFIGNFFRGKGNPSPKAGKPIPKSKGVRLGGFKAAGIMNAVFAGLDFKEGLDSGESTSLAAAGAGGALAGSLLGGAIGQALIPVPGLGFMLGSMAGNFLGGWAADRAHEAITGSGGVEEKQKEKLAQAEAQQKASAASVGTQTTFSGVLDKFETVVVEFDNLMTSDKIVSSPTSDKINEAYNENSNEGGGAKPSGSSAPYEGPISGNTFFPLPRGIISNRSVGVQGGEYGAPRNYPGGHSGQDIGGLPPGSPVVAWKTGKVSFEGSVEAGDTIMVVNHGNGEESIYKHVVPSVPAGSVVYGGQQIATLFAARAYPEHLHFEIWKNGSHTDPNGAMSAAQKISSPLSIEKAKEEHEKSSQTSKSGQNSGGPTVVLAAGTNNFYDKDPAVAAGELKRTIEGIQAKGYNVVYIPPNNQGEFKEISDALTKTASAAGASIQRAQYGTGDRQSMAHFASGEYERIRGMYRGATFMGDSNAAGLAGGQRPGMAVDSSRMEKISGFVNNLPQAPGDTGDRRSQAAQARRTQQVPPEAAASTNPPGALVAGQRPDKSLTSAQWKVQQQARKEADAMGLKGLERDRYIASRVMGVSGVAQQPVSPNQVSRYPEYNVPSQQIAIFPQITPGQSSRKGAPVMSSSSGGGGGGQISEGQSPSQLLNSYFTTALLTNLSST